MKSIAAPFTHVAYTSAEIAVQFGASGSRLKHDVTIPAGTKCIRLEGGRPTWVVQDLSFIPDRNSILYHDADHYGIVVSEDQLRDIQAVS